MRRTDRFATLSIGLAFACWWLTASTPAAAKPGLGVAALAILAVGIALVVLSFFDRPEPCPTCLAREQAGDESSCAGPTCAADTDHGGACGVPVARAATPAPPGS